MSESLGESAVQLPWLAPRVAALAALARSAPASDPAIADDPAAVLLLFRHPLKLNDHSAPLVAALAHLRAPAAGVLDRRHPVVRQVIDVARRCAAVGRLLAERSGTVEPQRGWSAGLLAPLGWLAVAAVDPAAVAACRADRSSAHLPAAIARRLARRWCLPAWLAAIVGHLDLPADTAPVGPDDRPTFLLAQAAVALVAEADNPLRLTVGTSLMDALQRLGFGADQAEAAASDAGEVLAEGFESEEQGGNPYVEPLVVDLLHLAVCDERRADTGLVARLEGDIDHLHRALLDQRVGEDARLRERNLTALAEFAAGAGHEINNPLAVISGQAQYLLAGEAEPARQRSLLTVVQQAQRIHQILTDLMQFARPARPQKRAVDVRMLAREVGSALHDQAQLRRVQIEIEEPDEACVAECDPRQLQTALGCLLRNAIEAAPADGWARLRIEAATTESLRFVVEDNGPGPATAQAEHLFDPFYSGRPAGRGRGLGLPTAWRLAREQGGDVAFEPQAEGPTRFVLTLPRIPATLLPQAPDRLSA